MRKSIKKIIEKIVKEEFVSKNKKNELYVFDFDDTLVKTTGEVKVIKSNKEVYSQGERCI